jgi:hypothetical protein
MLWLTCTSTCWIERVEQEFYAQADCQYALRYYARTYGVVGVCTVYQEGTP